MSIKFSEPHPQNYFSTSESKCLFAVVVQPEIWDANLLTKVSGLLAFAGKLLKKVILFAYNNIGADLEICQNSIRRACQNL